jgi:hypothetical protein
MLLFTRKWMGGSLQDGESKQHSSLASKDSNGLGLKKKLEVMALRQRRNALMILLNGC